MIRTYRLVWDLLNARERRAFVLVALATLAMAVFEVIGIAAILPFVRVLGNTSLIDTVPALVTAGRVLGIETHAGMLVALGLGVLALILLGVVVRAVVTWLQIRFSLGRSYTIASRILSGYLRQDYVWFLSRNSADLNQSLLSEIDLVVRESILPIVTMLSHVLILVLIAALLFAVEPLVALGAVGALGGSYILMYTLLRPKLGRIGRARIAANRERFRVVQEITGGLKEVKVLGLETRSLTRFRGAAGRLARNQATGLVLARLPRYALEGVVYGGFIGMILVMILVRGDDLSDLVPLFALIGLAATKLFPALQQLYQSLSAIRSSEAALERLHDGLTGFAATPEEGAAENGAPASRIALREAIEIENLRFAYPAGKGATLDGFSARIPALATVGIVGGTGAGKTTLVDVILGLLHPEGGRLLVDGMPLDTPARVRGWQARLGYVPQHIYLTDASVASNIAFGLPEAEIDHAAVERAARIAELHDFVVEELPDGYATIVGERGVRLSGGQRQRVGIARALYRDPDVLILDEATSALDNLTERAVMEAVHNLAGAKTVIMIAHRLSTVKDCDLILVLERGRLAAQGRYDELVETSPAFRRMASA